MIASNLPSLMEHCTAVNNDEKILLLFCHIQTKQKDKSFEWQKMNLLDEYIMFLRKKNKMFHLYRKTILRSTESIAATNNV